MAPAANIAALTSLLDAALPDTLVVAPEGALSGYENRAGFTVGIDAAAPDQTCPSMIVAPNGAVLAEITGAETRCVTAELELGAVSDWVLSQVRGDFLALGLSERRS